MSINPRYGGRPRIRAAGGALVAVLAAAVLACDFPLRPPGGPEIEMKETPTATSAPADTPTPSPAPPTEAPTDTPTATLTPTSTLGPPVFTTTTNANCRAGPGMVYDIVRVVLAGTTEPIVGKDVTGTWWVVQGGARCWISNITGMASGDLSGVPVIPAPPTPTPSPTATPTITPTPTMRIIIPLTPFIPIPRTPFIPLPPIPHVSSAAVTVDRTTCMPCRCRATWSGSITATGALTANYVWETRLDAGPWTETALSGSLTFSDARTLSTVSYWQEVPAGTSGSTITARLHVTSPNSVYSNEVSVRFCAP